MTNPNRIFFFYTHIILHFFFTLKITASNVLYKKYKYIFFLLLCKIVAEDWSSDLFTKPRFESQQCVFVCFRARLLPVESIRVESTAAKSGDPTEDTVSS